MTCGKYKKFCLFLSLSVCLGRFASNFYFLNALHILYVSMCVCVLVIFIVVVFECAEYSCVCRLVAQRKQNKNPNFSLLISLLTNGTHRMRVCRTVNYGHTIQCLHFTYLIPLEMEMNEEKRKKNCEYVPHGKIEISSCNLHHALESQNNRKSFNLPNARVNE